MTEELYSQILETSINMRKKHMLKSVQGLDPPSTWR